MSAWREPMGTGLAFPRITPVVKWLLIVQIGIFLVTYFMALGDGATVATLYRWLGVTPSTWFTAPVFLPFWQVVTYGWLHSAGSFGHILWNMLLTYFFGTMLEEMLGSRRFLSFYLAALVLAGIACVFFGLLLGEVASTIGASGAILAVIAALAVLRPQTPVILLFFPIPLVFLAIGIVAIDLLQFIGQLTGRGTGVSHLAHLSGALFGFLAARKGWLTFDVVTALEDRRRRRAAEDLASAEKRLDALLDRIHKEGIGSLSASEREFLQRMSQRDRR